MNKEKYIREIDSVVPSEEFKKKLSKLPEKQKKKSKWPAVAALAACLAFIIIAVPAAGMMNSKVKSDSALPSESYYNTDESYNNVSDIPESQDKNISTDGRKITRTAQMNVEVKNLDDFIKKIKNEVNNSGGYVSSENKSVYDYSSSCTLIVNVPADRLEPFIDLIDTNSTVISKQVDSDDISDEYIDTEAKIKSLETEQETLLKLLEKAEDLDSVIQLQDRLAQIRSELDSYKSTKKMMDNQVEYSSVMIYINESERTVKTDGSFFSEVKEKFLNSIYSIGDFFRELAINFLGGIPYIAIVAVIAVIVVIIIKKKRKKNSGK